MAACATVKQAKDYLAERIAAAAAEEGVPLSEIERKMLYFSQTDWTLPNMAQVSAQFDEEYDQDAYEQKIDGLVRKITAHHHGNNPEEEESWDSAVEKLSEGDHYLSVLTDPSLVHPNSSVRPPHDILKLWLTAFAIVLVLLGVVALRLWLFGPK